MDSRIQVLDDGVVLENVPLTFEEYTYKYAHIAYLDGQPPAPVVLVHPNYAGAGAFFFSLVGLWWLRDNFDLFCTKLMFCVLSGF